MKNLIVSVIRLLTVAVLLAPLNGGLAATEEGAGPRYAMSGEVLAMDSKNINIGDMLLRLSPTVKVVIPGRQNATLSDISPGDNVGVRILQYRGKAYVDTIFYLTTGGDPVSD